MKKLLLTLFVLLSITTCEEKKDFQLVIPDPIYYRLQQIDYDGNEEVFNILRARTSSNWWDGTVLQDFCDNNPTICVAIQETYNNLCDTYPTQCEQFCAIFPEVCRILPIELIEFKVARFDDHMEVRYTTGSEVNSDYVNILASLDGEEWYVVEQIPSTCPSGCEYVYEDYMDWYIEILNQ